MIAVDSDCIIDFLKGKQDAVDVVKRQQTELVCQGILETAFSPMPGHTSSGCAIGMSGCSIRTSRRSPAYFAATPS